MNIKNAHSKYCNCQISFNKEILEPDIHNSFCEKCGSILLKGSNGTINYTLKPKQKVSPYEFNPFDIIKKMKTKTEKYYPNINNLYNNPKTQDKKESDKSMISINIYLKYRKRLLTDLQKLIKKFDYCDSTFYQCLFYLDTFLSHDINIEMSEKNVLYQLVGYFLCAVKLKEIDIYEPSFDSLSDLEKGKYLSPNKIGLCEILCLKRIHYNIFSYSAYDWIVQFVSNGVIFNSEVDNTNELILIRGHRHSLVNTINKYSVKLLLSITPKDIFFKYSPMYLALSLIQISREKFINQNKIKPKLFNKLINLYGIYYNDYQQCYEEIKSLIFEESKHTGKDNKNNEENIDETKAPINLKKLILDKKEKNLNDSNNKETRISMFIKSSKNLISLKDKFIDEGIDEQRKNKESRNNKSLRNKHFSIDCSSNVFKSNETLQFLKLSSNKDIPKINPLITKSNEFLIIKKEENKIDKDESNNKLTNIRLKNKKHLTLKNSERAQLEKLINSRKHDINIIELNKKNNNINDVDIIRKAYKLKTYKHLEIKADLHE